MNWRRGARKKNGAARTCSPAQPSARRPSVRVLVTRHCSDSWGVLTTGRSSFPVFVVINAGLAGLTGHMCPDSRRGGER